MHHTLTPSDFRAVASYEKTVLDHRTGRKCAICSGVLHDTIINFGDFLDVDTLQRAHDNAKKSDVFLVLGSSLTVPPASLVPEVPGKRKGASLAICNLQETPLDDLTDTRVWSKTDELMEKIMANLGLTIPKFILRRRLTVEMEDTDGRLQLKICGVDEDGTPATFLQSVRLEYNRRHVRAEPFNIGFRGSLDSGTELKLELEFMGHYGEPTLEIVYCYKLNGPARRLYLLAYDPTTGQWEVESRADGAVAMQESEHSVIDLTNDTTILSEGLSEVVV